MTALAALGRPKRPVPDREPFTLALDSITLGDRVRRDMGDIDALAASIADLGLMHPIVVRPDGVLIAGARRLEAFRQLGRDRIPATVLDLDQVVRGEYAENLFRKAFSPSEMADIADALEPLESAAARERQAVAGQVFGRGSEPIASGNFPQAIAGRALDHVAKVVGTSRRTIVKARAVRDAAIADPARFGRLREEMDRTGLVDGALRKLKAVRRTDEIAELAKNVPAASTRYRLVLGSVANMRREPADSVDFIVTDPPYEEAAMPLYEDLARAAEHILRPGGLLICMTGQYNLPEVFSRLSGSLQYLWTMAYLMPGLATQVFTRRVNNSWKPVLVYCKGDYAGPWYDDVARSEGKDKDHHHWGQSESGMRDLMRRFVRPGQHVADPFLGGGTTGVVALELGCTFLGFDVDQQAITATRARFANVAE